MKAVLDFLASTRVELEKVVWPTPQQTLKLTLIVVIVTVSVGFFVGGVDLLLTKALALLLNR
jgi:preprotein translocase subunit SecE